MRWRGSWRRPLSPNTTLLQPGLWRRLARCQDRSPQGGRHRFQTHAGACRAGQARKDRYGVLRWAEADCADRRGRLHAAHRRGAARRDPDRYLMRPARRLTRKCRALAAGQSSRLPACSRGCPNSGDEGPDRRNTIAKRNRRGCRMPSNHLGQGRKHRIDGTHHRPQRPNPHRDCGNLARLPADSFFSDLPTPARWVGLRPAWPASATLHETGNSRHPHANVSAAER